MSSSDDRILALEQICRHLVLEVSTLKTEMRVLRTENLKLRHSNCDLTLTLPDEVIHLILSFCDAPSCLSLGGTSRRNYELSCDDHIWGHLFSIKHGPNKYRRLLSDREITVASISNLSMKHTYARFGEIGVRWKTQHTKSFYNCDYHKGTVTALTMVVNSGSSSSSSSGRLRSSGSGDLVYAASDDGSMTCWEIPRAGWKTD